MSAFLSFIFYIWLGYWSYRSIKFLMFMITCHVLPSYGIYNDLKKYGKWAIVTGATDGIGKAYAMELAKQKFNIVLISRTEEKLQRVAQEIKAAFGVETKYIVFDFSTPEGYEEAIGNAISDLDVGVLVNNVGMSSKWDRLYDELDMSEHVKVMHTNTFGEMHMTYMLTKKMVQQKRGIMIHISSFFGYYPIGLISVYSPTKAFVNSFVQNLQAETKACKNIHHQLVTPFFVATNMTKGSVKVTKVTPDAATFVGSALRTVGLTPHTFGYWTHDIIGSILMTFPPFVFGRLPFIKSFQKSCKIRRLKTLEKSE